MADEKVAKLVEYIKGLSVLQLAELNKTLQEELGISAAMPMAVSAPAAGAAAEEAKPEEAKTQATVVLTDAGANKIAVIKALREIKPELGLKEAKDITEATPKEILVNTKMEAATAAKEKLEAAGGKVELK